MTRCRPDSRRRGGVTMVELLVVLTLTSVLAGGMAVFITAPFQGYRDLTRRARLVDAAENAIRRMARDVRRALPNSIRVAAGGTALELLHAVDGAKYRRSAGTNPGPVPHTAASDWLSFGAAGDDSWNVLGRFEALVFSYGTPLPAETRVAIYSTSSAVYADAATGADPGMITPAGNPITVISDGDEDQLQLASPFRFAFESPEQRLYVVDGPVSYLCDVGSGTLTRYASYSIVQSQPTSPTLPPLSGAANALVTRRVGGCLFTYQPGTPQRSALLTLELSLAESGEQVRLLHQIHVENVP